MILVGLGVVLVVVVVVVVVCLTTHQRHMGACDIVILVVSVVLHSVISEWSDCIARVIVTLWLRLFVIKKYVYKNALIRLLYYYYSTSFLST